MNSSDRISIDKRLILEFFLVLSRAEYALKASGFVQGNERKVSPNWDSFAGRIGETFNKEVNTNVLEAVNYYVDHHPHKQILKDGYLDWDETFPSGRTEIEKVLILVRRVRNNLFHGAKYYAVNNSDNDRNEKLLTYGICILNEVMSILSDVGDAYNEAIIE